MAHWGELKCPECADLKAKLAKKEKQVMAVAGDKINLRAELAAEKARSRRWREDLERWLEESETREATLNDRITMLEEERDDLAVKLEKVKVLMALGFAENERRLALAGDALEHAKLNMFPDQIIDAAILALKGDTP